MVKEFQTAKVRAISTLCSSKDTVVHQAGEAVKTSRKLNAHNAAQVAQEDLRHQELVGTVCTGRMGLGNYGENWWSTADDKTRRDMVVQLARKEAEQSRSVKGVRLGNRGNWTRWESAVQRPLIWKELWRTDQGQLGFLL